MKQTSSYPLLVAPPDLGSLDFRNRIVLAAAAIMQGLSPDNAGAFITSLHKAIGSIRKCLVLVIWNSINGAWYYPRGIRPSICSDTIFRWIWLVPSTICRTLASRI